MTTEVYLSGLRYLPSDRPTQHFQGSILAATPGKRAVAPILPFCCARCLSIFAPLSSLEFLSKLYMLQSRQRSAAFAILGFREWVWNRRGPLRWAVDSASIHRRDTTSEAMQVAGVVCGKLPLPRSHRARPPCTRHGERGIRPTAIRDPVRNSTRVFPHPRLPRGPFFCLFEIPVGWIPLSIITIHLRKSPPSIHPSIHR